MRISDWSSDVCSSDLVAQADIGHVLDVAVVGAGGVRSADDIDVVAKRHPREFLHQRTAMRRQPVDRFGRRELLRLERQQGAGEKKIGRASCRERWCQYV